MAVTAFWETNLAALDRRGEECRHLAQVLAPLGPAADGGLRSRTGTPLPSLAGDGRPRSLVSTFDAAKEAERWASPVEGGTVVVFGLPGVAALRALTARGVGLVFVLEPSLDLWRSVLTWEDWSDVAGADWVPFTAARAQWPEALVQRYQPVWDGGLRTLEWRAAVTGREQQWEGFGAATQAAVEQIAGDASTQARFGERWYRNTLANLRRLAAAAVPGCPGVRVVVAGAGPSLEDALTDDANLRWLDDRTKSGDRLYSTDTALPALVARGVQPDLVFCLDGQLATYHHFVSALPRVPVVADLAALPLLTRLGTPVVRYLSGHPLGVVVSRWFPELPRLDGSLGNVSGLAQRTALALGAHRVDAWGVDFAYRDGQAYARGTYVYDLAARAADRLTPQETKLGAACYGARDRERTRDARGRALDTTPLLRAYRRLWESPAGRIAPVTLAHGGAADRWPQFAEDWRSRLVNLPMAGRGRSVSSYVRRLNPEAAQDWYALWPLALALHRQGVAPADLPEAVRIRAMSFLED